MHGEINPNATWANWLNMLGNRRKERDHIHKFEGRIKNNLKNNLNKNKNKRREQKKKATYKRQTEFARVIPKQNAAIIWRGRSL